MIEAGTILQERYRVMEQIGAGGMGAVYVATDQRFNSIVAIKETFFSDENLSRAFEREARLLNGLRHPALARVSDHFIDGNGQFIVMEFIDGDDLSEMMTKRGEAFPIADVMNWADQLLDSLDYLHTQEMPIVHRDIKPQNLKLTSRGQIILLDFGLAKGNPANSDHQTNTKSIFGYSRIYAPLEQIQGTGTDPRSDFYSLAATIYHLMTGTAPEDALTRATAVLNGQPDPLKRPHQLRPEISVAISNVLIAAMALNANYRPSSAAAMRALLAEAKHNNSAVEQQFAIPAAQIFSQETQVIDGARTGAATPKAMNAVAFAAPTQAHSPASNPEPPMKISIPQTETTRVSQIAGQPKGRRFEALIAAFAALFGLLLLAGVSLALYSYNPDMFRQSTPETGGTQNSGDPSNGQGGEVGAAVDIAPGDEKEIVTPGEAQKDTATGKVTDAKNVKGAVGEKSERHTTAQTAEEAADAADEAAAAAAEDAKTEAGDKTTKEQRELQKAIRNLVKKSMKGVKVNDANAEREMNEAFEVMDNEDASRGRRVDNTRRPAQPPKPAQQPQKPKVKIIMRNPERPNR
jgi:serine/threonine protein kinase